MVADVIRGEDWQAGMVKIAKSRTGRGFQKMQLRQRPYASALTDAMAGEAAMPMKV
jgi:hypothetical protein